MEEKNDIEGLDFKGMRMPSNAKLPTHKRELKKVLLAIKPVNKPFISRFASSFTFQPIWKPIAVATLIIAVVVSLVIILPPLFGNDIIARAISSTERINSYSFSINTVSLDKNTGLTVNTYSEGIYSKGSASTPNSWQVRDTRDTASEDGWQTRDIIGIGTQGYFRIDDGDWNTFTFSKEIRWAPQPIDDLDEIMDFQIQSTSLVRGVACIHLVGTSSFQLSTSQEDVIVTYEIWIGEEDNLVRKSKISQQKLKDPLEISGSGSILVNRTREYFNYSDQPINILPPITP